MVKDVTPYPLIVDKVNGPDDRWHITVRPDRYVTKGGPIEARVEPLNEAFEGTRYRVTCGVRHGTCATESSATRLARTYVRDEIAARRTVPVPPAAAGPNLTAVPPTMLLDIVAANLAELRRQIEADRAPQPDDSLPTLIDDSRELAQRIAKRAAYDTLKALLSVLDGWVEGARENNEAMDRRDCYPGGPNDPERFHASDIRRMVNDAARMMGTNEPFDVRSEGR